MLACALQQVLFCYIVINEAEEKSKVIIQFYHLKQKRYVEVYHLTFNISKHKITSNWKPETSTMLADCSLKLWASSTTNQSNLQQVNRQATEIVASIKFKKKKKVESIHILSTTQRNNMYSTASLPQPQQHHIFELLMINDHREGVTANNN